MSINLITFRAVGIRVGAIPENKQRKSWWVPLFGWSSEPSYLVSENKPKKVEEDDELNNVSGSDPSGQSTKKAPTWLTRGGFTEEKARQLRMLTADMTSFHDVMYHSAIASRLASDFKRRPESDT